AASNAYAWLRRRPGSTVLVPGILMLVPGSMGYRGLSEMMAREVLPGIATAVEMVLVAVSLVAGLLAANVVSPPAGARPSRRRPEDPPTAP
ncbi:MAG: threonine/serine exporter family protein, partial [Myxococcales bacterium]|nr:threonine/serine exporter family protein [Myxococcales bacterium]